MGVLEANGTDRWALGRGSVQSSEYLWKLAVDAQGNFTLLGGLHGPADLGGGTLGPSEPTSFVARYTADGAYRWARTLDPSLDAKLLGGLPGGATLVGGSFHGTVQVEATQFGPSQGHDVLLLKLAP